MPDLLEIEALGGLIILHNGAPVTGFASRKAQALFVYLACNIRAIPREVLAELLWQERSQTRSLANLRVVLSSLREQVDPFIDITRQTVAFNTKSNYTVDVIEMESLMTAAMGQWKQNGRISRPIAATLTKAVDMYKGEFLQGFYLRDAGEFEEWVMIERERIRLKVIETLNHLAAYYLDNSTGVFTDGRNPFYLGIEHATRSLQMDPLQEDCYRQLMMLHARLGQRSQALSRYEDCVKIFKNELGAEPTEKTRQLMADIQSGEFNRRLSTATLQAEANRPEPVVVRQPKKAPPETIGLKKNTDSLVSRAEAAMRLPRVCRYCQHELPEDALKCPNCGKGAKTTVSLGFYEPEAGDSTFDQDTILLMHFFGVEEPQRIIIPPDSETVIGRAGDGVDLSPLNALENGVSRVHALLQRQGSTLVVSDLNSSNGTFLNGQRLYPHEVRVLRHGDELRLGKLVSRIRFFRP